LSGARFACTNDALISSFCKAKFSKKQLLATKYLLPPPQAAQIEIGFYQPKGNK
jgi:hypothetical protein